MIHIVKTKTGFQVVNIGKNGEPLKTSEILTSKQKCLVNIKAELNSCYRSMWTYFQDDTTKESKVYMFRRDAEKFLSSTPASPKYTPGKNKKKNKFGDTKKR